MRDYSNHWCMIARPNFLRIGFGYLILNYSFSFQKTQKVQSGRRASLYKIGSFDSFKASKLLASNVAGVSVCAYVIEIEIQRRERRAIGR